MLLDLLEDILSKNVKVGMKPITYLIKGRI